MWLERALPDARRNRKAEQTAVCGVPARAAGAGQGGGEARILHLLCKYGACLRKDAQRTPSTAPSGESQEAGGLGLLGVWGVLLFHSTPLDAARAAH